MKMMINFVRDSAVDHEQDDYNVVGMYRKAVEVLPERKYKHIN